MYWLIHEIVICWCRYSSFRHYIASFSFPKKYTSDMHRIIIGTWEVVAYNRLLLITVLLMSYSLTVLLMCYTFKKFRPNFIYDILKKYINRSDMRFLVIYHRIIFYLLNSQRRIWLNQRLGRIACLLWFVINLSKLEYACV